MVPAGVWYLYDGVCLIGILVLTSPLYLLPDMIVNFEHCN